MRHSGTILVTGATGAIGPTLVAELLASGRWEHIVTVVRPGTRAREAGHDKRVLRVEGDVCNPALDDRALDTAGIDAGGIEAVIHAAADTRFRAAATELDEVNVHGTANVLAWARRLPALRRFIFVSTTCVAGRRAGRIREAVAPSPPEFVNAYEASKWQAEQLVRTSGLPWSIVRLSTVVGSERDGAIHRLGAIHRSLQWLHRGLVPMLPGAVDTPVDLISTELAAHCLARCAQINGDVPEVIHVAVGKRAIRLGDLIEFLVAEFREMSSAWRQGAIGAPMIVDRETFELFRDSVRRSGDALFRTVLDSAGAFLPALLYPKVYDTARVESLLGGALPLPNWRTLLRVVIRQCVGADAPSPGARGEVSHA
jgi:nucleoside-diphosphate-sugar epimerase